MNRKQCRVLVTGAGSGVGQGIIKALNISDLPLTIVTADIAPLNAGLYRGDEAAIVPRVENPGALDEVILVLNQLSIDVVLIGSEFDVEFYSKHKEEIESRTGVLIVVAPPDTVRVANDKWLTVNFLRERGLPYAESSLPQNLEDALETAGAWGFPLVLKTRRGTSSRHVHILQDESSLREAFATTPAPMLQRLIAMPSSRLNAEFTCSVFKAADGTVLGPFTARRTVRGGTSWLVEVVPVPELDDLMLALGRKLDFMGSLNVQLMLTEKGPIPFEINARFSGTTAVRANFGFNEPRMALRSYYYNEVIESPEVRSGIAMRYHEEVFVDGVSADQLGSEIPKGYVNRWF